MLSKRLLQFGSATAALLLCTSAALATGKSRPPPLTIAEQGGFSFGGNVEINAAGESRHCDHGYTHFSIPTNARKLPIFMWHSTHVKTWESNPSFLGGHQAFQDIFLRRGWGVYIFDPPRQGQASYGCFGPDFVSNWPQPGRDRSFISWRLGTWAPGGPYTFFPGSRMAPLGGADLIDQILRARYPDNEHVPGAFDVEVDAVAKLLDKTGPAILFTHSGSGRPGWMTVFKSPKVAAIVCFEASVYAFPTGQVPPGSTGQLEVPLADFLKLTKIPIVIIFGDFLNNVAGWPERLANSKAFAAAVNSHGGNAKVISLPDIGIHGNSHVMMLEENNVQIADLVSNWLQKNRLDKGGKDNHDDDDDHHHH